jgi:hypothetical protein
MEDNFQIEKREEIIEIIKDKINDIDQIYRTGKSLDRYITVLINRKNEKKVEKYLTNDDYLKDIYKTLEAWDMNKRGAKLRKLSQIKQSFNKNMDYFIEIENMGANIIGINIENVKPVVKNLFNELYLMESNSKLVSFSKTLHFIFPYLFMPMDGQNTLKYFYNNASESFEKYFDIFSFFYDIAHEEIDWQKIVNDKNKWNTTIPKIIDNAIIIKMSQKSQIPED